MATSAKSTAAAISGPGPGPVLEPPGPSSLRLNLEQTPAVVAGSTEGFLELQDSVASWEITWRR